MQISDEQVDQALTAPVPGGSRVWHWINGGGMEITKTHCDVMRTILEAALSLPVQPVALVSAPSSEEAAMTGEDKYRAWCEVKRAEFADDPADLPGILRMLDRWGPEALPADDNGQVHFARSLLDSAAEAIRKHLATTTPPVPPTKGPEDDLIAEKVTPEALRDDLLSVFRGIAVYWANLPDVDKATGHPLTVEGRCDGVVFSILSNLDGCGSLPSFDLVAHVHTEDEDQSLEGVVISDMLHEHYGSAIRSRPASALPVVGDDGLRVALSELLETLKIHKRSVLYSMSSRETDELMAAMHKGNAALTPSVQP